MAASAPASPDTLATCLRMQGKHSGHVRTYLTSTAVGVKEGMQRAYRWRAEVSPLFFPFRALPHAHLHAILHAILHAHVRPGLPPTPIPGPAPHPLAVRMPQECVVQDGLVADPAPACQTLCPLENPGVDTNGYRAIFYALLLPWTPARRPQPARDRLDGLPGGPCFLGADAPCPLKREGSCTLHISPFPGDWPAWR